MLTWLSHWNNWPFLLSLLVGIGLVAMTVLGFSKDIDQGVDVDADLDVGKPDLGKSASLRFGILGVGKVPLSVVLEVFLVSFGLMGLLMNAVLFDLIANVSVVLFPVTFLVALGGATISTRLVADLISKYAPADNATARRAGDLAGMTGTALSSITHHIGQVRVVFPDKYAPDALVNVYLDPSETDTIARDTEVHLISYDTTRGMYRVRPLTLT